MPDGTRKLKSIHLRQKLLDLSKTMVRRTVDKQTKKREQERGEEGGKTLLCASKYSPRMRFSLVDDSSRQ